MNFCRRSGCLQAALILGLVAAAYGPALTGGLIWDDNAHVTRPELQSLHGLRRIWTELGATQQYYPVLHTAFWIEHRIWGNSALGYHLANVLFHVAAACLFAGVLRRLGEWPPVSRGGTALRTGAGGSGRTGMFGPEWLAALTFALHPVCVESVAWISEQKNTLSTVFYLMAGLAYLQWRSGRPAPQSEADAAAGPRSGGHAWYALATFLFVLALLTKSVTATLPAALLVIVWWKEGRLAWRRDVLPLMPWLVLGAGAGLFTSWVERRFVGASGPEFDLGIVQRSLLACRAVWFYLGKLAWPANLVFIYPRWHVGIDAKGFACAAALAALFGALWICRRKARGPLAALLFFVGSLFPALGFFNVYPFLFSYVADHWQYLASLGIFAMTAAALWTAVGILPGGLRAAGWVALAVLELALGLLTWRQCRIYRDVDTLYRTTLAGNPDCWLADLNLGNRLLAQGRTEDAVALYRTAIRLEPNYPSTHFNLGRVMLDEGRTAEAIGEFQAVLRIVPADAEAHNNLGVALANSGRSSEAESEFEEALRCRPDYPRARENLELLRRGPGSP